MERHILRERTSSSHIFFPEPGGANACTPLQACQRPPDRLRVPRSTAILCTLSKSDRVVLITRSPSGYTPVRPECPDAPSSSCDSLPKHTVSLGTNRKSKSYIIQEHLYADLRQYVNDLFSYLQVTLNLGFSNLMHST